MNTNPLQKAVKAAMFAGAAMAVALPATTFAADADNVEEVTVTGSRIVRDGFERVSPVSVTTAEDIKVTGFTRAEDFLNNLPSIEAAQTSFISNGSSGTASLDLRGLGANRTLVLVNGRRMQSGGIYSQAPDINQIPSALVERVEVLTAGASSTYGADAVAGVVNFIMKKDFEGFETSIGMSGYQHDNDNKGIQELMDARGFTYPTGSSGIDGKTRNVAMTMGSEFADGKGHAVAYATWRDNDELKQEARDYTSCALNNAGTSCGGSFNAIIPNFILTTDAVFTDYDYWTLDQGGNGFDVAGGLGAFLNNPYNYAPVNHFMRPDTRYSLGTFVDYEVNDNFKPYMEAMFTHDRTKAQIAESGTFFAELYEIPLTSSLLDPIHVSQLQTRFGLAATDSIFAYIGKRNVEGGPRTDILEHNAFRVVGGTKGDLTENWKYDVSYTYGQTSSSSNYINDFFAPNILEALDAGTYDVFRLNGVTPEQANNLTAAGALTGITSQKVFTAFVDGDLNITMPGATSPVALVAGIETRTNTFERNADVVFEEGLLLGQGGATTSIIGEISVDEVFVESVIPIIQGNQDLTAELGLRFSDYNPAGDATTYKIAATYKPTDWLKLRGGFNHVVRAPNVGELFAPQNDGLWNGTDPCGGATPILSAAQCANTGVTASQYGNIALSPASQYNGLFGGNVNLKPEEADTISFGAVIDPLDNLTVSVDYWDIELENVIGAIGAELTVTQCALTGNPNLCGNIQRGATGTLWLGSGTQTFVRATNINLASRHFEGIDLAARYDMDVLGGNLTANLLGTFMVSKEFSPIPGATSADYECVGDISTDCFPQPEWRHTLKLNYDNGGAWSAGLNWRYYGNVHYYGATDTIANGNLKAQSYIDLNGSYDVSENIGLVFGISNVMDKEPPLVGGTLSSNGNAVAGYYDSLGRYLHGTITFSY